MWAPWRLAYLQSGHVAERCFLCDIGAGVAEAEALDLVVWRGHVAYALLNRYPYANGHVMVAPYVHEGRLDRLGQDVATELTLGVQLVVRGLEQAYGAPAFNVGANLGAAAGAGFADHLHVHVVPRWPGDTNFMTTTCATRVIPEGLHETASLLRQAVSRLGNDN